VDFTAGDDFLDFYVQKFNIKMSNILSGYGDVGVYLIVVNDLTSH